MHHALRPYQLPISQATATHLAAGGRAQTIMACGTGKTLTGMRTVERIIEDAAIQAPLVVLAFPNLALLGQTVREWRAQSAWHSPTGVRLYEDIAVCSDTTIDPGDRKRALSRARRGKGVELDVAQETVSESLAGQNLPATTDPGDLVGFLTANSDKARVVFSTYQSMHVVADAAAIVRAADPKWQIDLILADEAHRTAGNDPDSPFATVLKGRQVPAARRLFMTATQRVATSRQLRGKHVRSMDDESMFGPVTGQYTFKQAIEAGHLSDYQVHVVLVRQKDVENVAGEPMADLEKAGSRAHTITAAIATAKLARRHNLNRVMAFHNRIAHSQQFIDDIREVHDALTKPTHRRNTQLRSFHVDGTTPTPERDGAISTLADLNPKAGEWGVVSNVSVFTEGIDVPTLDCVVFADPRDSEVDVAQIVGRALRKSARKTNSAILIPVMVREGQDADAVLASSEFEGAAQVIKAMRTVDARIVERFAAAHLDELALQPEDDENEQDGAELGADADEAPQMGDQSDASFLNPNEDSEAEPDLGTWHPNPLGGSYQDVGGGGSPVRITAGDMPGATPVPEGSSAPEPMLVIHAEDLLDGAATGPDQAQEAARVRYAGLATFARRVSTAAIEIVLEDWEIRADQAASFYTEHGRTPSHGASDRNERLMGMWLKNQRTDARKGALRAERLEYLDRVLPGWLPDADARWIAMADKVARFRLDRGRAPTGRASDPHERHLGSWLANRRTDARTGTMSADRRAYLDRAYPGWLPDRGADWRARADQAAAFLAERGRDARASARDPMERRLGQWLSRQRQFARKGTLSAEQHAYLDNAYPGWLADRDAAWRSMVDKVVAFHATHDRGPSAKTSDSVERRLGQWLSSQRHVARGGAGMPAERRAYLDRTYPGWLQDAETKWRTRADSVASFRAENGRDPSHGAPDPEERSLGGWLRNHRTAARKGLVSAERLDYLDEVAPGWLPPTRGVKAA